MRRALRLHLVVAVAAALALAGCRRAPRPAPAEPASARPADRPEDRPCGAADAEDLVTGSDPYQLLVKKNARVKLTDERPDDAGPTFDLRAFAESPSGEALTLDRFRVDFGRKQLLRYNPIDDEYVPVAGAAPLFLRLRCR